MFRHAHHREIDSTNVEAARCVAVGELDGADAAPLVITADRQTAGRGRSGRRWRSPAGGLWMSVAWSLARPAERYGALPLVAGLAVAEALERRVGVEPRIKWPNDLLVGGRKLAGILCALELNGGRRAAIVGIGLNGNIDPADLGAELRLPATSLLELRGRPTDLVDIRVAICERLATRLKQFESAGLEPMHRLIVSRLALLGEPVAVEPREAERWVGRVIGLAPDGRLMLEVDGRRTAISIGDVTHLTPTGAAGDAPGRPQDLEYVR